VGKGREREKRVEELVERLAGEGMGVETAARPKEVGVGT
jgi:hypothetical protein